MFFKIAVQPQAIFRGSNVKTVLRISNAYHSFVYITRNAKHVSFDIPKANMFASESELFFIPVFVIFQIYGNQRSMAEYILPS